MALVVKNTLASAGDIRDSGSIPGSGRWGWVERWRGWGRTRVVRVEMEHWFLTHPSWDK